MKISEILLGPNRFLAQRLNVLQPAFALGVRLYVSLQFLLSGWHKLESWSTTLWLFESEYHVPLLPPGVAAVTGTFGELFFPALLVVGFASRVGALGLFAVNAMAVVSYSHVLFAEGYEAALGQHVLWGLMAAYLAIHGPGRWSFDAWLGKSMSMRHSTPSHA